MVRLFFEILITINPLKEIQKYKMKLIKKFSHNKSYKKFFSKKISQIGLALLMSFSSLASLSVFAEADSSSVTENDYNGGYLKIGYGYKNVSSPYFSEVNVRSYYIGDVNGDSIFVNGRYQWEGLFVEVFHGANERNEGLSVGYNFHNTEHWSFDINTVTVHSDIESEIYDTDKIFYQQFDSATMVGLRATGHYGQTTMQFLLAPYIIDDEIEEAVDTSLYLSAWLGHSWQIKNWSIHGSIGLEYRSADLLDYYYGISAEEATDNLGEYQADAGVDFTTQLSTSYPISENWLFESYLRYTDLSKSINDSPVMKFTSGFSERIKEITEVGILVSYVF